MSTGALREPYEALSRQRAAAVFAMWLFLATEVLFFGGLFGGYAVYRYLYPAGFLLGARHSAVLYGAANTVLLLTSSLSMAIGVRAARAGLVRPACLLFVATAALGIAFLAVKGLEYAHDLSEHLLPGTDFALAARGAAMFWTFYWMMTAVHAVHLLIGIGAVLRLPIAGRDDPEWLRDSPAVQVTSLYWQFVDAMWLVLFALLYLGGRT